MAKSAYVQKIMDLRQDPGGDYRYGFFKGLGSKGAPRAVSEALRPEMEKLVRAEGLGTDMAKRGLRSSIAGKFFGGSLSKLGAHAARFMQSSGRSMGITGFSLPAETFEQAEEKLADIYRPRQLRSKPVRRRA